MSLKKRRSRILALGSGYGQSWTTNPSGVISSLQTGSVSLKGTQITESEGHPYKHQFIGRDDGGEFLTTKEWVRGYDPLKGHQVTWPAQSFIYKSPTGNVYQYDGPVFPIDPATIDNELRDSSFTFGGSDRATLNALGATAISRCKPGQPVVDLAVGLAELFREGMPHMVGSTLWQTRAKQLGPPPKKGSDEYLNWVFGWQPLIADIKNSVFALRNQDALLSQYERDSGRLVRRRYDFPLERVSALDLTLTSRRPYGLTVSGLKAGMFKNDDTSQGTLRRTTTVEKERWFSGAFTYYLPAGYYSRSAMIRAASKAKVLLGIELTPEVIWNLTPWSWAADWFANTGDVLSNVSDFGLDGLVMHYGYMMETSTVTREWILSGHGLRGAPDPLTLTLVKRQKQRIKASPFGFGLTWDSFTPRQIGILTALGISKSL